LINIVTFPPFVSCFSLGIQDLEKEVKFYDLSWVPNSRKKDHEFISDFLCNKSNAEIIALRKFFSEQSSSDTYLLIPRIFEEKNSVILDFINSFSEYKIFIVSVDALDVSVKAKEVEEINKYKEMDLNLLSLKTNEKVLANLILINLFSFYYDEVCPIEKLQNDPVKGELINRLYNQKTYLSKSATYDQYLLFFKFYMECF